MNMNDVLDMALAQQQRQEPLPQILANFPDEAQALRPLLETAAALELLQPVEMPAAADRLADRAAFMAQLDQFAAPPVSPGFLARLKGWLGQHRPGTLPIFQQKESQKMSVLLLKAALVLTMVFGSVGGTAVLAAESLPDSPLYPIKLTIEETQLALAKNPAQEAALQMAFAQERYEEIQQMTHKGTVPDEATLQHLQTHWQQVLQLAAQMPESEMTALLLQAQTIAQHQQEAITAAQVVASDNLAAAALEHAGQILSHTHDDIQSGLQDPQTFRSNHGHIPHQPSQPPAPCPDGSCGPGDEMPQPVQPPPGNGYPGPGMGDGECNTPGSCDPMGDENHYGQDPMNDGHNGPGDGTCADPGCDPMGDENHYGQDPMNDGHNGPGDGACTDCDPMGDENHYGQDPMNGGQNGPGDCTDCNPMGDQNHNGSGDCMDCNQNYNGQDSGNMNPGANTPPPNNNNWDNNNNNNWNNNSGGHDQGGSGHMGGHD
ncbi:MAG TPA: hypothetical protein ENK32_06915 [Anaerolineae bacterium]|nr:hypothetical protein [Anaerolineae bacterium]